MMGNRRDRSHSPSKQFGGKRKKNQKDNGDVSNNGNNATNMMNPMMMNNMLMGQGNMMGMANMSSMYGNMMMPNMMGSNMMGTGMDMMNTSMDMTNNMAGQMGNMNTAMNTMSGSMGNNMSSMSNNMGSTLPAPPLPPGPPPMDMSSMMAAWDTPMLGNIGSMGNMGMYNMGGGDMSSMDRKEIVLKYCKLEPPPPGTAPPNKRVKPHGCRTIFVGGLPEGVREVVVREIFENYGRINTLRLSTKNFCHIRFERENCVDAAMMISGFRIKLIGEDGEEEEDTKQNCGVLHVDYALSRDDQNEYERRHRHAMRQQEQQMQTLTAQQQALAAVEQPRWCRSPSPPYIQIQPFSGGAIMQLCEKVKSEEQFASTLSTLIAWLERGECSKKNSNQFYAMIQATNSHIRRLFNEKMNAEEEFITTKEQIKNKIQCIIDQLEQVAKVFTAAMHQRVWDHFTKAQRKNIETWQKMALEFNNLKDEFNEKFCGDEIEGYNNGFNMKPLEIGNSSGPDTSTLKMENESLKFQLEAYKNEVEVIKAEASKELEKFKAQFIARQALQGYQGESKPPLPTPATPTAKPPPPPPLPDDLDAKVHLREAVEAGQGEAKLIGVMAAFLQVHPQGASLDYVVSYVRALFPTVSQATIHHVLQKHGDAFQRTTSGVGANIEHKWSFVAFTNTDPPKTE